MNATVKTILLTVLTLSVFVLTLVELSGISSTAFLNKYASDKEVTESGITKGDQAKRDEDVKKMPQTTMSIPETKHLFGHVKEGEKVSHAYTIRNTGAQPLMIANVQTSCGCTAPSYPKEPIMPGQEGEVTLEFNSAGKEGHVLKNALIIANTPDSPFSIGFEAEVDKK